MVTDKDYESVRLVVLDSTHAASILVRAEGGKKRHWIPKSECIRATKTEDTEDDLPIYLVVAYRYVFKQRGLL